MEKKCHRSYRLGWEIGKDLILLMLETKERVSSFTKQMKCLKEYEAVQKTVGGNRGQLGAICFSKGTKKITSILWKLAKKPTQLAAFLKADEELSQAQTTYDMHWQTYMANLRTAADG